MSEIRKLLNSLSNGVSSGALDESWFPYINRAMTELRELEATQHTLAPDVCSACKGTGIDQNNNDLYCGPCGGMGRSNAGKA